MKRKNKKSKWTFKRCKEHGDGESPKCRECAAKERLKK